MRFLESGKGHELLLIGACEQQKLCRIAGKAIPTRKYGTPHDKELTSYYVKVGSGNRKTLHSYWILESIPRFAGPDYDGPSRIQRACPFNPFT